MVERPFSGRQPGGRHGSVVVVVVLVVVDPGIEHGATVVLVVVVSGGDVVVVGGAAVGGVTGGETGGGGGRVPGNTAVLVLLLGVTGLSGTSLGVALLGSAGCERDGCLAVWRGFAVEVVESAATAGVVLEVDPYEVGTAAAPPSDAARRGSVPLPVDVRPSTDATPSTSASAAAHAPMPYAA
jgi:hypothetical protein